MELAAVLEVSPAYLSLIATNRQPMSEPIAFKMEKLFGLSAEWILFEKIAGAFSRLQSANKKSSKN